MSLAMVPTPAQFNGGLASELTLTADALTAAADEHVPPTTQRMLELYRRLVWTLLRSR